MLCHRHTLISSQVPFSSSKRRSFALRTTRLSSSESESLEPTMNLRRVERFILVVTRLMECGLRWKNVAQQRA